MTTMTHVVCAGCNAVNRLPAERLDESPNCGKCGEPIFTAKPIELTDANFQKHVGRSDIPVVAD